MTDIIKILTANMRFSTTPIEETVPRPLRQRTTILPFWIELVMVENPEFAVRIFKLSITVPEMPGSHYFRFWPGLFLVCSSTQKLQL